MELFSVQQVHCELRKWLHANTSPEVAAKTRIIYGGAVMNLDHIILLFICFSSLSLSQFRFLVSSFFFFLFAKIRSNWNIHLFVDELCSTR